MSRLRRASGAVALLLAAGAGALALARVWSPAPDFHPVRRASSIDRWKVPWAAEGREASPGLPRKWIVMGWDGASWDIILPLLEQGRLPHLASLMQDGAFGVLHSMKPTHSAVLWTTVATGVSPARHGILGFAKPTSATSALVSKVTGRPPPVRLFSNADRRVKALWNVASEHGRPVMVVGYHNTFPAEAVSGLMVSNYFTRQRFIDTMPGAGRTNPQAVAHMVYPPTYLRRISGYLPKLEEVPLEELGGFVGEDRRGLESLSAGQRDWRWDTIRKLYAYDRLNARIAVDLRDEIDPDFLFLHFQATDGAAHYFLYFHAPEWFSRFPDARRLHRRLGPQVALYGGTVRALYQFADQWLGRLLASRASYTAVMVLSDHGTEPRDHEEESGGHNEAPPGILVMSGPGILKGKRLEAASLYDVLPTLMASAGLPVARDLEGRVLLEAFHPASLDAAKVGAIETYETGGRFVPEVDTGDTLHAEIEKELRSLGYIQ